jgi:hypothetical protein
MRDWAMRLKRVFNIDVSICPHCQGSMKIIACIEERPIIDKILAHINNQKGSPTTLIGSLTIRAPPFSSLLVA